jgi:hypothetical protein
MAKYYDDLFDGLKRASEHLVAASNHMVAAHASQREAMTELVSVADAALHAHSEEQDFRETVARLEGLVMELVRDVRILREQKNGGPGGSL